jgi:hypothetical protein
VNHRPGDKGISEYVSGKPTDSPRIDFLHLFAE